VRKEWGVGNGEWRDKTPSLKIFTIFIIVSFGIFACTETKSRRDGIVIADSKKYEASLYRQNCAICHGKEAYGKQVDGKPVPSLRFGDVKKKSEEEIYQQIVNGKLPMPSFKNQLSEKEIRQMVDFIMYDLQVRERKK
jgi:cytochrome c5